MLQGLDQEGKILQRHRKHSRSAPRLCALDISSAQRRRCLGDDGGEIFLEHSLFDQEKIRKGAG